MKLHKITTKSHNSGQSCLKPFSWLDGAASHRPGPGHPPRTLWYLRRLLLFQGDPHTMGHIPLLLWATKDGGRKAGEDKESRRKQEGWGVGGGQWGAEGDS